MSVEGLRVYRAGFNFHEGVAALRAHFNGRWYPELYAKALEDVAEAARALDENYEGYSEAVPEILAEIRAALDRLDAASVGIPLEVRDGEAK